MVCAFYLVIVLCSGVFGIRQLIMVHYWPAWEFLEALPKSISENKLDYKIALFLNIKPCSLVQIFYKNLTFFLLS
jgi:hypothetical protein